MKYVCQICGYVYDEAREKVPFAELPDDWTCPLCGAAKSDFAPQEEPRDVNPIQGETPQETVADAGDKSPISDDMQKLSAGQMAGLCSNLARGCEKQYKYEESELFARLAEYFSSVTPAVDDATVESVASRLKDEIAYYPEMKSLAQAASDRGSQRVCVWGEKVTKMLSSLVGRYLKEGETMLEDTEIWLCTVCGFVYIGKQAPEICPVCKVPSWKFEKM